MKKDINVTLIIQELDEQIFLKRVNQKVFFILLKKNIRPTI